MSEAAAAVQQEVQEQAPPTTVVGQKKKAAKDTGNLLLTIASEVENLTKTKALHMADNLAESIEENYFKLGGVLKLIGDNSWFEGYESFAAFVFEKYGFGKRKADYLIKIYTQLVTKQIPWEKVSALGWTKLKDLADLLTPENVDEWVAKVKDLTYMEMMAVIKAQTAPAGGSEVSGATTDDVVVKKFKLKVDQVEVVDAALAKCKGEIGTEYDTVALENICAGYVGGLFSGVAPAAPAPDLKALIASVGWEATLQTFAEVYPDIDLDVKAPQF